MEAKNEAASSEDIVLEWIGNQQPGISLLRCRSPLHYGTSGKADYGRVKRPVRESRRHDCGTAQGARKSCLFCYRLYNALSRSGTLWNAWKAFNLRPLHILASLTSALETNSPCHRASDAFPP